jgi:hypothetical protein
METTRQKSPNMRIGGGQRGAEFSEPISVAAAPHAVRLWGQYTQFQPKHSAEKPLLFTLAKDEMIEMMNLSSKYQPWIEARERFHLSHAHIQMARELGLNPRGFGKLANHKHEPWKAPLPDFIAGLYKKRFGKDQPNDVRPLEQIIAEQKHKKAARKAVKQEEHNHQPAGGADFLPGEKR